MVNRIEIRVIFQRKSIITCTFETGLVQLWYQINKDNGTVPLYL